MREGKNYKGGVGERKNDVDDVVDKIKRISNFSKELNVENFAKENGYADKIAKELKDLNPTQLRRFFDAVKEIENKLKTGEWDSISEKFYLLQPQLAYAKGRRVIPARFYELMKVCLNKIDIGDDEQKKKNYERFTRFLEAIVAYQKYHYPSRG
jgi:CRISPR-associated protein Csm2